MSLTTGILQFGTGSHLTSSEEANAIATDFVSQGIVGTLSNTNGIAPSTGGFAVNAQASPDATVAVSAGVAYVTGTPTSQGSQTLRVKNSATTNVTISANSSGSTKYDWLYIKLDPTNLANPNTAADNVATLVTSRSSNATTDDGGSTPTYGYLIAVVTVANGFSTITNANIADRRSQTGTTASGTTTAPSSWSALGYTPTSVTALGNRSYSMLYSNVDLSATLSAGMRQRTTRTVAAPTKCTSLNGTTQYYSKSSPAGMTFTDDFVVSAWVKLTAYGTAAMIASRYNGTSGWFLNVESTGQVSLQGANSGAGNLSYVRTYQSIPLNKWVHVTAQLDMSAFTATTTTSYVMIDGVDVPASVTRIGTNPTALIQAGNLEIGSWNGGAFPFPGKIAQVAIYNAKVAQATILASIHQGLAGTETSLISAYSFNNTINDLNTTNANNLTANGSAVATNADSPFGGQADGTISSTLDYAIIQKVAFSTNTTVTVQVPEGCTIPTSGGVSSVVYSSNKAPYGMPVQRGKWCVEQILKTDTSQTSPVSGTWYNFPAASGSNGATILNIPAGEWATSYSVGVLSQHASSTDIYTTLSTANNTESDTLMTTRSATATTLLINNATRNGFASVSSATNYFLNAKSATASTTAISFRGSSDEPTIIRAENAYL